MSDLNPYSNTFLPQFFWVFLQRLFALLTGKLSFYSLVSDEIQILVMTGVALSCAMIGSFLTLRKMTMLANSISHTILLGIVLAYFLLYEVSREGLIAGIVSPTNLIIASLLMALITAFLTEFLTKHVRLQEDASIGLVFTTLFALGVMLVTLLTRDTHLGLEAVMGNADFLRLEDSYLVYGVLFINCLLIFFFFKEYQITTFDPPLARALGFSTLFFNYLLMTQFAATAMASFRAVGVLMVLSFITAPPMTARLLCCDLKKMIALAMIIAALTAISGVALSRHILTATGAPLSTAGLTVCLLSILYWMVLLILTLGKNVRSSEKKEVQDRNL